jgi:hypothetical protein
LGPRRALDLAARQRTERHFQLPKELPRIEQSCDGLFAQDVDPLRALGYLERGFAGTLQARPWQFPKTD